MAHLWEDFVLVAGVGVRCFGSVPWVCWFCFLSDQVWMSPVFVIAYRGGTVPACAHRSV